MIVKELQEKIALVGSCAASKSLALDQELTMLYESVLPVEFVNVREAAEASVAPISVLHSPVRGGCVNHLA